MDLRQYLIAPHEQPSRHGTSDLFRIPKHQQQSQQHRQQFQSHPQHPQHQPQPQQQSLHHVMMHQPHQHPQITPFASEQHNQFQYQHQSQTTATPLLTRDQVLKGLSLYPDILASVLFSQTDGDPAVQSQGQSHNDDTADEYQISHWRLSMLGNEKLDSCYTFAGKEVLGQEQARQRKNKFGSKPWSKLESEKISNVDKAKLMDKEPTTSTTIPIVSIPTSPRAGRYAKGQRLQRQRHFPPCSHVQRQEFQASATAGVSIPTSSKTLKRKASKAERGSSAGYILNKDADASFLVVKRVRKSGTIDEAQGVIGGASDEQLRKNTESSNFAPQPVQELNEDPNTDLDTESNKHAEDSIKDSIRHSTKRLTKKANKKAKRAHHNSVTPAQVSTSATSTPPHFYTSTPSSPQLYTTFLSL
ncbi:hypothetical protein KCU77_g7980, partial [Aureobasidium melanogenum]